MNGTNVMPRAIITSLNFSNRPSLSIAAETYFESITINAILLSSPGCIALSSVSKTNQPCAPPRTLPKMKSSISKPIMPMYAHIAKVLNML